MFSSFFLFLSRVYAELLSLFAWFCALFKEKEKVYQVIKESLRSPSSFKGFYESNVSLGLYHFYRGNISDARFRFRLLAKFSQNRPLVSYNLARCLMLSGKKEQAKRLFESLLSKGKEYEEVRFFLALLNGVKVDRIPSFIVKERYEYLAQEYVERYLIGKRYIGHKLIFEGLKSIIGDRFTVDTFSILDLGCGTGVCTHFLKLSQVKGRATGVDISENMLEIAKRCLVDGQPVFDSIVRDDIRSFLTSPDNREYDLILAADSFSCLGDLSEVVSSCIASMKDGGILVVLVHASRQPDTQDYVFDINKSLFLYSFDYIKSLGNNSALKNCIVRKCTFQNACNGIIAFYIKGDTPVA